MFKIGLIILALIMAGLGTTITLVYANNMGPADSGNSVGSSDITTSPSNSGEGHYGSNGFQENPNWSVSEWHQHHNNWLRSNGEFPGHHHFRSSCIGCHYSPGSEHFGSDPERGIHWYEEHHEHMPFVTGIPNIPEY